MMTREQLAREAGCLDLPLFRPGPDGRVPVGRAAEIPFSAYSAASTEVNRTGGWKSVRPLYRDRRPACQQGCPAGEDIARYMRALQRGQFEEGWRLIMEDNPFPSIMGRVCYHPCEGVCNRERFDEPVAIHAVERFLGEYGLSRGLQVDAVASPRREQVAVIGAGPAGLSAAYHLARRGYGVTMYEAQAEPGGVLRWAIPAYRLPRDILRREIARVEQLGVSICSGVAVGRDLLWDDLDRFQAVLLATGLPRSRRLAEGDNGVEGMLDGLQFLRRVAATGPFDIGRRVVVIGGGNVAIDAARSALRCGADRVSLVCVEPLEEMPAHPEETEAAIREGIELKCGFALRRTLIRNGRLTGLEIGRVRFLGRTPEGGVRFERQEESIRSVQADTVLEAIGQRADLGFLPADLAVHGQLSADGWGRLTPSRVFAAGDVVTGPARIVDAIASGKRAALGVDRLFHGESLGTPEDVVETVGAGDLNVLYFLPAPATAIPQLSVESRRRSMAEVNGSWDVVQARAEAGRCFNCGICTGCDNCLVFCPDVAIRKNQEPYSYEVLDQYCKGCGICARECPRHVITLSPVNP